MKKLVVVNDPKQWTLDVPGVQVIASKEYLTDPRYSELRNVRVFNLSRSFNYQSRGYYVSLLAEARGHKVIPSVRNILDQKASSMVKILSKEIDISAKSVLGKLKSNEFTLSIYFGRNVNAKYDRLAHEIYKVFQSPLLRAKFARVKDAWELKTLRPIPVNDIPPDHLPYVKRFAKEYFGKTRYDRSREDRTQYDLAILVNPADKAIPSNKGALVKFRQAATAMGMAVEFIGPDDMDRISEFDALFIRENTHVDHHTYRFARKAQKEGLAVIDSPEAILKCNNKVYLAEMLEALEVPVPKTMIIHDDNRDQVLKEFGLPVVLKLPDSTFSRGVVKARTKEELVKALDEILHGSDLAIAQEYLPTDFDWRIGIVDGAPIYACKYFMARGHWQIYNWGTGKKRDQTGDFVTIPVADAPKSVVEASEKAAKGIGKGLFGVDVKEIDGKAYVIEVNECPNIDHGVEDVVLGDELYSIIIASLKKAIEKKIGIRS